MDDAIAQHIAHQLESSADGIRAIHRGEPIGRACAAGLAARYGLDLPTEPAGFGRVFGYTDWLYGS